MSTTFLFQRALGLVLVSSKLFLLPSSLCRLKKCTSFSYLELYLSVSQILKTYRILPPGGSLSAGNVENIEAILPPRREWVAAVPTTRLQVSLSPRYPDISMPTRIQGNKLAQ